MPITIIRRNRDETDKPTTSKPENNTDSSVKGYPPYKVVSGVPLGLEGKVPGIEGISYGSLLFVCEAFRLFKGEKLVSYLKGLSRVKTTPEVGADFQFLQNLVRARDNP